MEQVMTLNASPRAPRSNSKEYAALFSARCSLPCQYFALKGQPAAHLIQEMEHFSHLLLVFPLYVDSLPVELLAFLEEVQRNPPKTSPACRCSSTAAFWSRDKTMWRWISCGCLPKRWAFPWELS